eukprot:scaffold96169_cov31-Tisochrysis_lutea.AAC.3
MAQARGVHATSTRPLPHRATPTKARPFFSARPSLHCKAYVHRARRASTIAIVTGCHAIR